MKRGEVGWKEEKGRKGRKEIRLGMEDRDLYNTLSVTKHDAVGEG